MEGKNMFFSLVDADISSKEETTVTYDDLLQQVNSKADSIPQDDMDLYSDLYFAEVLDYKDNYTKKQLEFIAGYYDIKTRKKEEGRISRRDSNFFEKADENTDLVQRRKMMWFYIDEIANDSYLSKYLILE